MKKYYVLRNKHISNIIPNELTGCNLHIPFIKNKMKSLWKIEIHQRLQMRM